MSAKDVYGIKVVLVATLDWLGGGMMCELGVNQDALVRTRGGGGSIWGGTNNKMGRSWQG